MKTSVAFNMINVPTVEEIRSYIDTAKIIEYHNCFCLWAMFPSGRSHVWYKNCLFKSIQQTTIVFIISVPLSQYSSSINTVSAKNIEKSTYYTERANNKVRVLVLFIGLLFSPRRGKLKYFYCPCQKHR